MSYFEHALVLIWSRFGLDYNITCNPGQ